MVMFKYLFYMYNKIISNREMWPLHNDHEQHGCCHGCTSLQRTQECSLAISYSLKFYALFDLSLTSHTTEMEI